jgi:hypothetical protein
MFILSTDGLDGPDVGAPIRRYREYLESKKKIFPPSAYALAISDWYFNPVDHRCPHDAWLESFAVLEHSSGDRHEIRHCSMTVRLRGAYHDGFIEIRYPQLFAYSLSVSPESRGHGDWWYNEFRVSDEGHLIHEIEWAPGPEYRSWVITASDMEFRWIPRER